MTENELTNSLNKKSLQQESASNEMTFKVGF